MGVWYDVGMDKATVCEMALHEVGEHEYVPDTPGYKACELYFRHVFLFLLKRHDWSFARKRTVLTKGDAGYALPVDCLRVVELSGLSHWRLMGRSVVPETDAYTTGAVELVYTSSEMLEAETVPVDMPDFGQVLVLHLAASLCGCVSGDEGKRQELLGRAETVLRMAMLEDAQQDASNDQHPLRRMLDNAITV